MPPDRRSRNVAVTVPAPVRGLNLRDPIDRMDTGFALVLDNLFPQARDCVTRQGHAPHATGLPDAVATLAEWSADGAGRLIAASAGGLYDVTAAGAVGAALATGFTADRWSWVNFKGRLVLANGHDGVRHVDGAAVTAPAFTDGAGAALPADVTGRWTAVAAHNATLWLAERGTLTAWHLQPGYLSGPAFPWPLDTIATKGGELAAIGSWSRDGGSGPEDLLVFVTRPGEVIVYSGTSPLSAATWTLVGRYEIPPPVGDHACLLRHGADLVVLTEKGLLPLSRVLAEVQGTTEESSLSSAIDPALVEAARLYGARPGWQALVHPRGGALLVNVPADDPCQYVANTVTGAWCRYTGMAARSWGLLAGDLYFGGVGVVHRADTGTTDGGRAIDFDLKTAFSDFGHPGRKKFNRARPMLTVDGNVETGLDVLTDFEDRPAPAGTASDVPYALWAGDAAAGPGWDAGVWYDGAAAHDDWVGVDGLGTWAAVRLVGRVAGGRVALNAVGLLYEPGAVA